MDGDLRDSLRMFDFDAIEGSHAVRWTKVIVPGVLLVLAIENGILAFAFIKGGIGNVAQALGAISAVAVGTACSVQLVVLIRRERRAGQERKGRAE